MERNPCYILAPSCRGFKRVAHDNEKSMVVDQIEADVAIPNGTESLFLFISRIQESGTHAHMPMESPW